MKYNLKSLIICLLCFVFISSLSFAAITDNLSSYYNLNETSGTTSIDDREALNGTYLATTTLNVNGIVGKAINFTSSTGVASYALPHPAIRSYNFWVSPSSLTGNGVLIGIDNSPREFLIQLLSATSVQVYVWDSSDNAFIAQSVTGFTFATNKWSMITLTMNLTNISLYQNATLIKSWNITGTTVKQSALNTTLGNRQAQDLPRNGGYDEFAFWDRAITPAEVAVLYNNGLGVGPGSSSSPVISNITCTSCNIPVGDSTPPYETDDTTPTFTFQTDTYANCRISDLYAYYETMGSSNQCSSGEGTVNHTCTLPSVSEITSYNQNIYLSCANVFNDNASNISTLSMLVSNIDTNATNYIISGVEDSVIGDSARIYTDQQVYLRSLDNTQLLATVDVVAAYGNQRWIFNYANESESTLGLFNLTPAVYVLDMKNLSLSSIQSKVTTLINNTKN